MPHQLLGGLMEIDDSVITAGVHTGPSEYQFENLRYIQADMDEGKKLLDKGLIDDTVMSFLGYVYDNSTGSMLSGDFKRN